MTKVFKRFCTRVVACIAQFLFPESCAGCGKKDTPLCRTCRTSIPFYSGWAEFHWIFPLSLYRNPIVHSVISRAKYQGRPEALLTFGQFLFDHISTLVGEETSMIPSSWILIPIPITKEHHQKRGYNQSEILAIAVLAESRNREITISLMSDILFRKSGIKSQASIKSRAERLKNPQGTFFIAKGKNLQGAKIILIDDVVTTGATLLEARRLLIANGAKHVIAVTLAYTKRR